MKTQAFTAFCTLSGKLTVAQRAFARVVYDGLEPAELPADERSLARDIFGAVEAVPAVARRVMVQVKGRDAGGSRLGAERCAHLGLTMPIDRIGPAELAYVVFGGPKLRHARIGLRHARNALKVRGVRILEDSKDGFTIKRHDGRRIRFEAFAASRGGDTVRGVPIVAAMLDEAGFYYDEASGVANAEAIFGAIIPRLLPGGQVLIISSPWAESGLLYTEFTRNHGAPVTALAALCPTGVMRDDAETLAMIAVERERDPENARRELDAEFMPTGSGHYFDHFAVGRCPVATLPLVSAPPHNDWTVIGGYDPAYVRDAAEGVIVRTDGARFEVVELFTRIAAKGKPLVPSEVDREFAGLVIKHGGREIATDGHYREGVRENVGRAAVSLTEVPGSNPGKVAVFGKARDLIHNDQVRWSEGHRRLTRQLREVIGKPLPGGLVQISSPRRRGDHGDAAHALCLALWAAAQGASNPELDAYARKATERFARNASRWGNDYGRGF
jgi:hypothetical protein